MVVVLRMVFLSTVFSFRGTLFCGQVFIRAAAELSIYSVARRWGSAYLWVWKKINGQGEALHPAQGRIKFAFATCSHSAGQHCFEFRNGDSGSARWVLYLYLDSALRNSWVPQPVPRLGSSWETFLKCERKEESVLYNFLQDLSPLSLSRFPSHVLIG